MFKIPKEREVPFGGIVPAPVGENRMMVTSNWRTYRPVIDHEKCNMCLNCFLYCPDACWHEDEAGEKMVWNPDYCKGCLICVSECTSEALSPAHELDFEDGVVRLEKLF